MNKTIGGTLLVAGTTIGGGMLSLPITTVQSGFLYSTLLFIASWILMTFTAFLTLEVNLCFPRNSHMVSMARHTLGKPGAFIAWTVYLLLLYSIISAYIAGGQDVFHGLLQSIGLELPTAFCAILFVALFGFVVSRGVRQVDIVNRILMFVKMGAIFALIFFIALHAKRANYPQGQFSFILSATSIALLSFAFSPIVPTLRAYFDDDVRQLRIAILLGTVLPLFCYIAWNAVIFATVPETGDFGLGRLMHYSQPISGLLESLHYYIPSSTVMLLAKVFSSVCILTAFVSIALSLSDYLADGFKVNNEGWGKVFITGMTFLPPLLVAIFYPRAFILFLGFAGLFSILLLAFLPTLMAWICRYRLDMDMPYQVIGGKSVLILTMSLTLALGCFAGYDLVTSF